MTNNTTNSLAPYFVERPPAVNWTVLNHLINYLRNRSGKARVRELGMEEDLWAKKPLVTNINFEGFLVNGINTIKDLEPLGRVTVIFAKLFSNIRTDVAEHFLQMQKGLYS